MAEIARLSSRSDWIKIDVAGRGRTPSTLMQLDIRLHLACLSHSNTIRELEKFSIEWSRKTVHDW